MEGHIISARSTAEDFFPVCMAFHELLNKLPVTARSRDGPGIRIEDGTVIDTAYSGPILERVIAENTIIKTRPQSGAYSGIPVIVAPLRTRDGEAIGAIGVVDITGIFDLATLMEHQSEILKQVCGKDPCPLPEEAISSKR
ncbi:MAG TPA: DUF2111 domain-containing protein [Methanoculleus sp.]|nr:DUF2111 domain-containing protein [Methanomicrobiaceae archaeon]HDR73286.1 DUF2111 domain-containing protein [Methanoculleus sp.]